MSNQLAQNRHEEPPILKLVDSGIQVSGARRFVAKECFTKDEFFLWDNFREHFLDKVEEDVADTMLAIHCLEKRSLDAQIRKELGQQHEEISLAHFFDLLKKQSKGEKGHLLVNGCENIAYIRNKRGNLLVLNALWIPHHSRGWNLDATLLEDLCGHSGGYQVVSRDR